jgi:two-component system sensor histidine kinase ChvG
MISRKGSKWVSIGHIWDWMSMRSSKLGRMILGLNLLGLMILIIGALVLNEFRQGLVASKQEALSAQAKLTAEVLAYVATGDGPQSRLERDRAVTVLAYFIPKGQRARLFDEDGNLILDSFAVSDSVDVKPLGPIKSTSSTEKKSNLSLLQKEQGQTDLKEEVAATLTGGPTARVRDGTEGGKVVSVSIPITRVKVILGVLTLESGDVDDIITKQRWALLPFILVALSVSVLSSILMHVLVSRPIRHLSEAADLVRTDQSRAISLPDIEIRNDEIGALAGSLKSMTETLSRRMDEIERFAADVSHEIKNPLTSIRSALETLPLVKDEQAKSRLLGIINHDVQRLDRLITDISNASRLDAELSRDPPRRIDLSVLLKDILSLYQHQSHNNISISLNAPSTPMMIMAREGPMGQVFRNLLDNALSFSPHGGTISINLSHDRTTQMLTIEIADQGLGIPADSIEKIFERFYTSRPKAQGFGKNSGLGLSIVKQIIEAHQGTIKARNLSPQEGTSGAVFVIDLPLAG